MENIYIPEQEVGVWQWLFGKTVTSIVLLNSGPSDGFVGIAAPSLARILPIDLAMFGGELLCQCKCRVFYSRRCQARGLPSSLEVDLVSSWIPFFPSREIVAVDASCIIALTATINVQVKYNAPMRKAVFGGDNMVTAVLTGPGIVFIQSLPFHVLSQRVARAVTAPNMRENP